MKKFLFAAAATAAVMFASCKGGAGIKMASIGGNAEADLENDADTVSYLIGYLDANGYKGGIFNEEGVDSIYMDEFLKGVMAGLDENMSPKEKAYQAGIQFGMQRREELKGLSSQIYGGDSIHTLNSEACMAGMVTAFSGGTPVVQGDDQALVMIAREKMYKIYQETLEEQNAEYKKENDDYMAGIAKKKGIKTLGDGIYYEVLTEGTGAIPTMEQSVKLHYEGKTIDGNIFDSSYERGEPIELMPTQVIPGWTKALTNMPVGSKWIVYIPYEQGYGAEGSGPIKSFSALIFTIEILDIVE